ncbi:peroxisomal ABC transporter 1 [Striga asiatica]|uniref:Peroxisomal ABC transporter 1 n=1 Tax=Striga asiatica TaxID=4170 RepID=A0A5A7RG97_STRAF|nr:peroxisomal ABC transporter 1 [Striga asiatica]
MFSEPKLIEFRVAYKFSSVRSNLLSKQHCTKSGGRPSLLSFDLIYWPNSERKIVNFSRLVLGPSPDRPPENGPILPGLIPAQQRAFPQRFPAGGHNPVTDPQKRCPEEDKGHDEGHPGGNIDFQPNLKIVEEGEEQEPNKKWDPHRKAHSAYHPIRHYLRNNAFFPIILFLLLIFFLAFFFILFGLGPKPLGEFKVAEIEPTCLKLLDCVDEWIRTWVLYFDEVSEGGNGRGGVLARVMIPMTLQLSSRFGTCVLKWLVDIDRSLSLVATES